MYYEYFTGHTYRGAAKGKNVTVPADLHQVPLLIRGGSILPTRERPRRSSPLMKQDPFTLRIALDKFGQARGELYLDDGESYSHQAGNFVWREFTAAKKGKAVHISSTDLGSKNPREAVDGVALAKYDRQNNFALSVGAVRIEKIVVLGLDAKPKRVTLPDTDLEWEFAPGIAAANSKEGTASVLTIKNPVASIVRDWDITIHV